MKKILILGVNGFIGHHLTRRIIDTTDWHVFGMDMNNDRVQEWLDHPRFHFFEGDITINKEWIEYHVKKCDVVLQLLAIATPSTYVKQPIQLVDGGEQKRAFTYIDDCISALMKIIENRDGKASGQIYNIGNPANNYSIRQLATMMLALAVEYPEYRVNAGQVEIVETTSAAYYGKGYQDVQNRVPKIDNTKADLDWA